MTEYFFIIFWTGAENQRDDKEEEIQQGERRHNGGVSWGISRSRVQGHYYLYSEEQQELGLWRDWPEVQPWFP